MSRRAEPWLFVLLALGACRNGHWLGDVAPPRWTAMPEVIVLPTTVVGVETHAAVTLTNAGVETGLIDLSADAPFDLSASHATLAGGASLVLDVSLTPTGIGDFSGTLRAGPLALPIFAKAAAAPICEAPSSCEESHAEGQQCVAAPKPDGAACSERCLEAGACAGGQCLGQPRQCDDGDACTTDSCSDAQGCAHERKTCPAASDACQVATCDAMTGCGFSDALDGTLCGPDDCLATTVNVCLFGHCETRPRPASGRCANRWVPVGIPGAFSPPMAYDAARGEMVVLLENYAGGAASTWTNDGTGWARKFPSASPSTRWGAQMVYDGWRQRVVLFGGSDNTSPLTDTWEWDGTTWLLRAPATSPPPRTGFAMAFDESRGRVVVFGGDDPSIGSLADTWEWDGATWLVRNPAMSPPPFYSPTAAYDAARKRTVMFINDGLRAEVWEWDGSNWSHVLVTPPPSQFKAGLATYDRVRQRVEYYDDRTIWDWDGTSWSTSSMNASTLSQYAASLAFDEHRGRAVLFGGDVSGYALNDTWEWDGSTWVDRTTNHGPGTERLSAELAYDEGNLRTVLLQQPNAIVTETWTWDGVWTQAATGGAPAQKSPVQPALAYAAARNEVLMVAAGDAGAESWTWDGAMWSAATSSTVSPFLDSWPPPALAYDAARQRVVLVSAAEGVGTWEWNGAAWQQVADAGATPPVHRASLLSYDAARQRTLLFGGREADGGYSAQLWDWDGSAWTLLPLQGAAPAAMDRSWMTFDPDRQLTVLFGGTLWSTNTVETWELDDAGWHSRAPVEAPSPWCDGLVYDSKRNKVELFCGADVWLFLP
jgi:hypothetical protein